MKVKDLNKLYDELQLKYGEPTLSSIYNGGCENNPDYCFIFMNPTGKNIACTNQWKGRRAPWIGTKNIWKLFYNINLLDEELYLKIIEMKPKDWDEEFAERLYDSIETKKIYITNLGKCTQIDARPLSDKVLKEYLDLLYKEIDIIKPKKIIVFGNQVSSIFLNKKICVKSVRKQEFNIEINNNSYPVYSVFYPIGNGMRNIDLAIEDLNYIINKK